MKGRKTFRALSIHKQARRIVLVVLALFVVMCGLISVLIKQLVYRNEEEHMQVTSLRLYDQISLNYEKIENFCVNIGENEEVRALMGSDYPQMAEVISGATECLTRHQILEPMIEDISLVNDRIHYSNVYRAEELDRMRESVNQDRETARREHGKIRQRRGYQQQSDGKYGGGKTGHQDGNNTAWRRRRQL